MSEDQESLLPAVFDNPPGRLDHSEAVAEALKHALRVIPGDNEALPFISLERKQDAIQILLGPVNCIFRIRKIGVSC
jgi:hypothetical protein